MTTLFLCSAILPLLRPLPAKETQNIRAAAVAGSFYPAEPAALTGMINPMMAKVQLPLIDGPILAVVAPHAGYEYSGPVAAYTYAALKGHKYSRVVVIAPSHYEAFEFSSVYDGSAYSTPLGTVSVDKEFAQRLTTMSPSLRLSSHGHMPAAEHAIEVQLPWLQTVLGGFTLVPVIMGDQSYEASRALGVALAELIGQDEGTLIVASSDLSHYHTYREAKSLDRKTLDALQSWDYLTMARNFNMRVWEACGGAPIVAAMIAADRRGANEALLLKYQNSGDITGDRSRVVGYSAVALVKSPHPPRQDEDVFSLSENEKQELLALARASVEHTVREQKMYEPKAITEGALARESGAFVTITRHGELRGCIGFTDPVEPLYRTVRDTAALAALRDPRFPPVSVQELPDLDYEISVLSPLRRVSDFHEIHPGKHGLLVRQGSREGLLLPQVATEQHWDRAKFLEQTCAKAGMPPQCWKDKDSDVFLFTAQVFGGRSRASK